MQSRFTAMRVLALASVCVAAGGALGACGSSPAETTPQPTSSGGGSHGSGGGAAASTTTGAGGASAGSASTGAETSVSTGAAGTGGGNPGLVYPAFKPTVPQILGGNGPVLAAAQIVPVLFPASTFKAEIADYIPKAVASAEWLTQLAEYGVGAATAVPPVMSAGLPTKTISQADLETFIAQQVGSGAWGTPDTGEFGSQLYVLFLPQVVTISLPNGKTTCNGGPAGYHNEVVVGSTHVPYAAIANCNGVLDQLTHTAWHEMGEACTDPFAAPNKGYFKVDQAWVKAFVGGENGDMCEHRVDNKMTPPDIGYAIQRMWSNASAAAYHDPCLPTLAAPYFAAAPVLPDMVMIGPATVPGVKIDVASARTIDVQLFSDGPTPAPFDVSAKESLGGTSLAFAWDKTSGQNGDVLHLTITALANTPTGTTFEITSTLGASSSQWVGAVGN